MAYRKGQHVEYRDQQDELPSGHAHVSISVAGRPKMTLSRPPVG